MKLIRFELPQRGDAMQMLIDDEHFIRHIKNPEPGLHKHTVGARVMRNLLAEKNCLVYAYGPARQVGWTCARVVEISDASEHDTALVGSE